VTIHSATGDGETTLVGSNNAFLAGTHLAHNVQVGNRVIVSGAMIAGHVLVEDGAVVAGLCGIHQFCRIGTLSMVGGFSRISQDVAPYMLVNGIPPETVAINKVGLTRNNIPAETQNALRGAHKILFREGLAVSNALARIEQELPPLPEVRHLVEFVRSSERGITA
jgi:UDP-N-acetylglucosamine acyltransferase